MKVYVSYFMADSGPWAGRLMDRLAGHFGAGNVLAAMGHSWEPNEIAGTYDQEVLAVDVVLVVMGPRWSEEIGHDSLEGTNPLRGKLEKAIAANRTIVPVVVGGAHPPLLGEYPGNLKTLDTRPFARIDDRTFHADVDRLIRGMAAFVDGGLEKPSRTDTVGAFVSHAAEDREWVEEHVVAQLTNNNIEAWYAPTAIQTAADWERKILEGMESTDCFVVVVSPKATDSEWVRDELNWAMHHRAGAIIPVVREETNMWALHIRLPRIQHIDMSTEPAVHYGRLVEAVKAGAHST